MYVSDEAMETWKVLRGNYRRSVLKIAKWHKQPSGSGVQKQKKPRAYRFAAELAFLDDLFAVDDVEDSMTQCGNESSDNQRSEDEFQHQARFMLYIMFITDLENIYLFSFNQC